MKVSTTGALIASVGAAAAGTLVARRRARRKHAREATTETPETPAAEEDPVSGAEPSMTVLPEDPSNNATAAS